MRLYELCRSPADPRKRCAGDGCRCKGRYVFVTETAWRPAGQGEREHYCRGCGTMHVVLVQPVTYWARCQADGCKFPDFRVRGASFWRTWMWRLFGRHEGLNDWDMWRGWL